MPDSTPQDVHRNFEDAFCRLALESKNAAVSFLIGI
jgi:hypothetical protein